MSHEDATRRSSAVGAAHRRTNTIRVSVGDVLLQAAGPPDFVDESLRPTPGRIQALVGRHEFDPGLIPRATMVRARDGAPHSPLRTFSGRLAHENGLIHSRKSGRSLSWQGKTQRAMIVKAQTMHDVEAVAAESVRFEYVDKGVSRKYTVDLELLGRGGIRLLEMKRDERDLADPDLCRTLAIVAELCRCCAIGFEIVFARDVFASRIHRAQAEDFASRSSVPIRAEHLLVLRRHAEETGGRSTFGDVLSVLCPTDRREGTAALQAMTVARMVEIDLTTRVRDGTPVLLHPSAANPAGGARRDRAPTRAAPYSSAHRQPPGEYDMSEHNAAPRNNVPSHTALSIDGVDMVHRGYTSAARHDIADAITGAPFVMKGADGVVGLVDDEGFADLLQSGRLTFRYVSPTHRLRLMDSVARYTLEDAIKIDPGAEKRLFVCNGLDALGAKNGRKAVERGLHAIWTPEVEKLLGGMPSAATVCRWRRERGRPGLRHARDMVGRTGRVRRRSSLAEPVEETLQKHALDRNARGHSIRAGYALFVAEVARINSGAHPTHAAPEGGYPVPSKRTFRRRCDALEQSATVAAGRGKAAMEQGWEGGGRPLTADYALHRVIIDHTPLDVHAVDHDLNMVLGRPWLTIAIDVHTRAVVAWLLTFMTPSAWTVAEVLRRIALPKRPPSKMLRRYPILRHIRGKPTEIVLDNAPEFTSHSFEAAARAAGLGVRWCPIRKPRYRAVGERIFRTINTWTCEELPGRVLSTAETRRLGYDPEKHACVMLDEIEALLNQVMAEYNTEPHEALGERQPALVFEHEVRRRGIDVWVDFEGFRLDTLPGEDGAQLAPGGIRAFGTLRYADKKKVVELLDDLVPVEGRRQRRDQATATVSYRYDPLDLSRIHVWNRVTRKYVTLTCTDERYSDGMPLAFHQQLREDARSQGAAFNSEAEREAFRADRIHAVRQISPAASARARKAVADLYEAPRIRQITGNIVDLRVDPAEAVSVGDFISHDRAALTAFDVEVRSPRSSRSPRIATDLELRRDARDAGGRHADDRARGETPPALQRRRRRGAGEPT